MFELAVPAFIAGLLTFLAPCTLPLVPGYLGFISGTSLQDFKDPAKALAARRSVLKNGIFFVIGFSVIFILMGLLAGAAGQLLIQHRLLLSRIGGVFVVLFGLFMLNVIKLPGLIQERRIAIPSIFTPGKPSNALVLGATFGLGWTPCVGPILASILFLASSTGTIIQGATLLAIFSLGLALPFIILAAGIGKAFKHLTKVTRYLNVVSLLGGIFLIALGLLMVFNQLGYWTQLFYSIFDFIHYERLLNYL